MRLTGSCKVVDEVVSDNRSQDTGDRERHQSQAIRYPRVPLPVPTAPVTDASYLGVAHDDD